MPRLVTSISTLAALTFGLAATGFALNTACATEAGARTDDIVATPDRHDNTGATLVKYDPRQSLAPMLKRVMPAVVSIRAKASAATSGEQRLLQRVPPWFAPMLPEGRMVPRTGVGSGFVIDASGVVVTNHHVVDGHDVFEVSLHDERVVSAKVLGSDPLTDIALLQLEGVEKLPTVRLGSSSDAEIGDFVVAVGSPMGLERTASTGIISGKGRGSLNLYRDSYIDFLQTDAPISPGSSGGPLFTLDGRVVGINTAINGVGQSLGFAIPATQAARIITQLRDHGVVARGWLGIAGRDIQPAVGETPQAGAVVGTVQPNTPAQRAGLEAGDRIVAVDKNKVRDFRDFRGRIAEYPPGSKAKLSVVRDGKPKSITVKLGKRPTEDELAQRMRDGSRPDRDRDESIHDSDTPRLGVDVRSTERTLTIERVMPDSLAFRLGLQAGDELISINGLDVHAVKDVAAGLRKDLARVEVKVRRGKAVHTAVIERG